MDTLRNSIHSRNAYSLKDLDNISDFDYVFRELKENQANAAEERARTCIGGTNTKECSPFFEYDDSVFSILEENHDRYLKDLNPINITDKSSRLSNISDKNNAFATNTSVFHEQKNSINSSHFASRTYSQECELGRFKNRSAMLSSFKDYHKLKVQRQKLIGKNPFKTLMCNIVKYSGYKGRESHSPKLNGILEHEFSNQDITLRHSSKERVASKIIHAFWQRYVFRSVYNYLREVLYLYSCANPAIVLRHINPLEASLIDQFSATHVRFRLGGSTFPPVMLYKIFTGGPVVQLCNELLPARTGEKCSRMRSNIIVKHNSWRPFCDWHLKLSCSKTYFKSSKLDTYKSKSQAISDKRRESCLSPTGKQKQKCFKVQVIHSKNVEVQNCSRDSSPSADGYFVHLEDKLPEDEDELLNWARGIEHSDPEHCNSYINQTPPCELLPYISSSALSDTYNEVGNSVFNVLDISRI